MTIAWRKTCGLGKAVLGTAIVAAGLAAGSRSAFADDTPATKPSETKPTETKPTETPPADVKPSDAKPADAQPADSPTEATPVNAFVLDHSMKDIDGADQPLSQYKGKVVLIVNVASKCGFTPQYKGLQELFDAKQDKGLVVLGFPANNFGRQEPGTDAEIKEFCSSKYSVTFPMFSKVSVKGDDICGLFKDLTSQPAPIGGEVGWNFTKFLVDRAGNVVARYDSRTRPDDVEMNKKIDELLAASAAPAEKKSEPTSTQTPAPAAN